MPTAEKIFREELANLPTVKYPDEVIEQLKIESDIARHQLAIGEIVPMTVEEFAAGFGINLE